MPAIDLMPAATAPLAASRRPADQKKRSAATGPNGAGGAIDIKGKPSAARSGIPLELAPFLSPYEGYKHLSLRVERLPALDRLSKGRNNGDRTWSLSVNELDDLVYLPPEGAYEAHKLAIRIITLDGDYGATLAVIEIPVPGRDSAPEPELPEPDPTEAENRRLRDELAAMQETVADRDRRLQSMRAELADAVAELEKARAAWRLEEDERFAKERVHAEARLDAARASWRQEAEEALRKAKELWSAEEAHRLASAEAGSREKSAQLVAEATARAEQSERALTEARAEAGAARQTAELELSRLRQELAVVQASLAEREAAFDAARQTAEARLLKAEEHSAAQLEMSRATWQAELAGRVGELEARARKALEDAREQWRKETETVLAEAEDAWKRAEAVRLAAAEAHWRQQSGQALAEAIARYERAEAASALAGTEGEASLAAARTAWEAELERRVSEAAARAAADIEASRAAWKAEEDERVAASEDRARAHLAAERERWQQEAKAALRKAEEAWKAEEAGRLAAADARWQEQSASSLAEAAARYERAEAELAEARAQPKAAGEPDETAELRRLRGELATVQAALAGRDTELAEARRAIEHVRTTELGQRIEAERNAARIAWQDELQRRLAEAAAEAAAKLETQRAIWQSEEANRRAEAEACWREQTARALTQAAAEREEVRSALAEARAEAEAVRARLEHELHRLRDELNENRTRDATRDSELSEARAAFELLLERRMAEAAAAAAADLEASRSAWQRDETTRLAAAEARWREQSSRAIAETTARAEAAEAALSKAREEASAGRNSQQVDLRRLQEETAAARAALRERERSLSEAQSALEKARSDRIGEIQTQLKEAEEAWKAEEDRRLQAARLEWEREHQRRETKRKLANAMAWIRHREVARRAMRLAAVAAFVAASARFYPRIEPIVVEQWWPNVESPLAAEVQAIVSRLEAPAAPRTPQPAQVAERHAFVAVANARVRSGPSTDAAVIATLPRDREVTPLDERGYWVRIRIDSQGGRSQQEGWIYRSFLEDGVGR